MLLIGALLMSFMIPNLSALSARALRDQAEELVAKIDLARQRSVMTGVPHRLVVDLERGSYTLEWAKALPPEDPDDALFYVDTGDGGISLEAPAHEQVEFAPVPGVMGHTAHLPDEIAFSGVEAEGGWVDFGEAYVRFESDGSASYATIVLNEPDGHEVSLEILPLADTVRIRDDAS